MTEIITSIAVSSVFSILYLWNTHKFSRKRQRKSRIWEEKMAEIKKRLAAGQAKFDMTHRRLEMNLFMVRQEHILGGARKPELNRLEIQRIVLMDELYAERNESAQIGKDIDKMKIEDD